MVGGKASSGKASSTREILSMSGVFVEDLLKVRAALLAESEEPSRDSVE